jgi:hypothetical protein
MHCSISAVSFCFPIDYRDDESNLLFYPDVQPAHSDPWFLDHPDNDPSSSNIEVHNDVGLPSDGAAFFETLQHIIKAKRSVAFEPTTADSAVSHCDIRDSQMESDKSIQPVANALRITDEDIGLMHSPGGMAVNEDSGDVGCYDWMMKSEQDRRTMDAGKLIEEELPELPQAWEVEETEHTNLKACMVFPLLAVALPCRFGYIPQENFPAGGMSELENKDIDYMLQQLRQPGMNLKDLPIDPSSLNRALAYDSAGSVLSGWSIDGLFSALGFVTQILFRAKDLDMRCKHSKVILHSQASQTVHAASGKSKSGVACVDLHRGCRYLRKALLCRCRPYLFKLTQIAYYSS